MKAILIGSIVTALVWGISSCHPSVRQAATVTIPRNTASNCVSYCQTIGLHMSAVVIIMNQAGCVCEPRAAATVSTRRSASSAVAGGAVIAAVRAQQQQQQQQQQKQRRY